MNELESTVRKEHNWQTRIGYFKFAGCTAPEQGTAHFIASGRVAPLSNALVSIDSVPGATLTDVTYDPVLPPGSHTYARSNPVFRTQTGSFTVTNGQSTVVKPTFE